MAYRPHGRGTRPGLLGVRPRYPGPSAFHQPNRPLLQHALVRPFHPNRPRMRVQPLPPQRPRYHHRQQSTYQIRPLNQLHHHAINYNESYGTDGSTEFDNETYEEFIEEDCDGNYQDDASYVDVDTGEDADTEYGQNVKEEYLEEPVQYGDADYDGEEDYVEEEQYGQEEAYDQEEQFDQGEQYDQEEQYGGISDSVDNEGEFLDDNVYGEAFEDSNYEEADYNVAGNSEYYDESHFALMQSTQRHSYCSHDQEGQSVPNINKPRTLLRTPTGISSKSQQQQSFMRLPPVGRGFPAKTPLLPDPQTSQVHMHPGPIHTGKKPLLPTPSPVEKVPLLSTPDVETFEEEFDDDTPMPDVDDTDQCNRDMYEPPGTSLNEPSGIHQQRPLLRTPENQGARKYNSHDDIVKKKPLLATPVEPSLKPQLSDRSFSPSEDNYSKLDKRHQGQFSREELVEAGYEDHDNEADFTERTPTHVKEFQLGRNVPREFRLGKNMSKRVTRDKSSSVPLIQIPSTISPSLTGKSKDLPPSNIPQILPPPLPPLLYGDSDAVNQSAENISDSHSMSHLSVSEDNMDLRGSDHESVSSLNDQYSLSGSVPRKRSTYMEGPSKRIKLEIFEYSHEHKNDFLESRPSKVQYHAKVDKDIMQAFDYDPSRSLCDVDSFPKQSSAIAIANANIHDYDHKGTNKEESALIDEIKDSKKSDPCDYKPSDIPQQQLLGREYTPDTSVADSSELEQSVVHSVLESIRQEHVEPVLSQTETDLPVQPVQERAEIKQQILEYESVVESEESSELSKHGVENTTGVKEEPKEEVMFDIKMLQTNSSFLPLAAAHQKSLMSSGKKEKPTTASEMSSKAKSLIDESNSASQIQKEVNSELTKTLLNLQQTMEKIGQVIKFKRNPIERTVSQPSSAASEPIEDTNVIAETTAVTSEVMGKSEVQMATETPTSVASNMSSATKTDTIGDQETPVVSPSELVTPETEEDGNSNPIGQLFEKVDNADTEKMTENSVIEIANDDIEVDDHPEVCDVVEDIIEPEKIEGTTEDKTEATTEKEQPSKSESEQVSKPASDEVAKKQKPEYKTYREWKQAKLAKERLMAEINGESNKGKDKKDATKYNRDSRNQRSDWRQNDGRDEPRKGYSKGWSMSNDPRSRDNFRGPGYRYGDKTLDNRGRGQSVRSNENPYHRERWGQCQDKNRDSSKNRKDRPWSDGSDSDKGRRSSSDSRSETKHKWSESSSKRQSLDTKATEPTSKFDTQTKKDASAEDRHFSNFLMQTFPDHFKSMEEGLLKTNKKQEDIETSKSVIKPKSGPKFTSAQLKFKVSTPSIKSSEASTNDTGQQKIKSGKEMKSDDAYKSAVPEKTNVHNKQNEDQLKHKSKERNEGLAMTSTEILENEAMLDDEDGISLGDEEISDLDMPCEEIGKTSLDSFSLSENNSTFEGNAFKKSESCEKKEDESINITEVQREDANKESSDDDKPDDDVDDSISDDDDETQANDISWKEKNRPDIKECVVRLVDIMQNPEILKCIKTYSPKMIDSNENGDKGQASDEELDGLDFIESDTCSGESSSKHLKSKSVTKSNQNESNKQTVLHCTESGDNRSDSSLSKSDKDKRQNSKHSSKHDKHSDKSDSTLQEKHREKSKHSEHDKHRETSDHKTRHDKHRETSDHSRHDKHRETSDHSKHDKHRETSDQTRHDKHREKGYSSKHEKSNHSKHNKHHEKSDSTMHKKNKEERDHIKPEKHREKSDKHDKYKDNRDSSKHQCHSESKHKSKQDSHKDRKYDSKHEKHKHTDRERKHSKTGERNRIESKDRKKDVGGLSSDGKIESEKNPSTYEGKVKHLQLKSTVPKIEKDKPNVKEEKMFSSDSDDSTQGDIFGKITALLNSDRRKALLKSPDDEKEKSLTVQMKQCESSDAPEFESEVQVDSIDTSTAVTQKDLSSFNMSLSSISDVDLDNADKTQIGLISDKNKPLDIIKHLERIENGFKWKGRIIRLPTVKVKRLGKEDIRVLRKKLKAVCNQSFTKPKESILVHTKPKKFKRIQVNSDSSDSSVKGESSFHNIPPVQGSVYVSHMFFKKPVINESDETSDEQVSTADTPQDSQTQSYSIDDGNDNDRNQPKTEAKPTTCSNESDSDIVIKESESDGELMKDYLTPSQAPVKSSTRNSISPEKKDVESRRNVWADLCMPSTSGTVNPKGGEFDWVISETDSQDLVDSEDATSNANKDTERSSSSTPDKPMSPLKQMTGKALKQSLEQLKLKNITLPKMKPKPNSALDFPEVREKTFSTDDETSRSAVSDRYKAKSSLMEVSEDSTKSDSDHIVCLDDVLGKKSSHRIYDSNAENISDTSNVTSNEPAAKDQDTTKSEESVETENPFTSFKARSHSLTRIGSNDTTVSDASNNTSNEAEAKDMDVHVTDQSAGEAEFESLKNRPIPVTRVDSNATTRSETSVTSTDEDGFVEIDKKDIDENNSPNQTYAIQTELHFESELSEITDLEDTMGDQMEEDTEIDKLDLETKFEEKRKNPDDSTDTEDSESKGFPKQTTSGVTSSVNKEGSSSGNHQREPNNGKTKDGENYSKQNRQGKQDSALSIQRRRKRNRLSLTKRRSEAKLRKTSSANRFVLLSDESGEEGDVEDNVSFFNIPNHLATTQDPPTLDVEDLNSTQDLSQSQDLLAGEVADKGTAPNSSEQLIHKEYTSPPKLAVDSSSILRGMPELARVVDRSDRAGEKENTQEYQSFRETLPELQPEHNEEEITKGEIEEAAIKEEPDWLKCGYTQEPDTIFLSDEDEMIMSFSQPTINLVSSDEDCVVNLNKDSSATQSYELKIKDEKDETNAAASNDDEYDEFKHGFSEDDWSDDKGSDFDPNEIIEMIRKNTSKLISAAHSDSESCVPSDEDLFRSQSRSLPVKVEREETEITDDDKKSESNISGNERNNEDFNTMDDDSDKNDFSTGDEDIAMATIPYSEVVQKSLINVKEKSVLVISGEVIDSQNMTSSQSQQIKGSGKMQCASRKEKNSCKVNIKHTEYEEMTPFSLEQDTQVDPNVHEDSDDIGSAFDFHSEHFEVDNVKINRKSGKSVQPRKEVSKVKLLDETSSQSSLEILDNDITQFLEDNKEYSGNKSDVDSSNNAFESFAKVKMESDLQDKQRHADVYNQEIKVDSPDKPDDLGDFELSDMEVDDPQTQSYFQDKTSKTPLKNQHLVGRFGIKFVTFDNSDGQQTDDSAYDAPTQVSRPTVRNVRFADRVRQISSTNVTDDSDSKRSVIEESEMLDMKSAEEPEETRNRLTETSRLYLAGTQIDFENISSPDCRSDRFETEQQPEQRAKFDPYSAATLADDPIAISSDEDNFTDAGNMYMEATQVQKASIMEDDEYLVATQVINGNSDSRQTTPTNVNDARYLASTQVVNDDSNDKHLPTPTHFTDERYFTATQVVTDDIECKDNEGDKVDKTDGYVHDDYEAATQVDTTLVSVSDNEEQEYFIATQIDQEVDNRYFEETLVDDSTIHSDSEADDSTVKDNYNDKGEENKNEDKCPKEIEGDFDLPDLDSEDDALYLCETQIDMSTDSLILLEEDELKEAPIVSSEESRKHKQSADESKTYSVGKSNVDDVLQSCVTPIKRRMSSMTENKSVMVIKPQKLKTTAEKRASGLQIGRKSADSNTDQCKPGSSTGSSFKQSMFYSSKQSKPSNKPKPTGTHSGSESIAIVDSNEKNTWLSRKPAAHMTKKGKVIAGKRMRKDDTADLLRAKIQAAKARKHEREMHSISNPNAVAEARKKKRHQLGGAGETEDVDMPPIRDMGLPMLNFTGMLTKKPHHTASLSTAVTTSVPTTTVSIAATSRLSTCVTIATSTIATATTTVMPSHYSSKSAPTTIGATTTKRKHPPSDSEGRDEKSSKHRKSLKDSHPRGDHSKDHRSVHVRSQHSKENSERSRKRDYGDRKGDSKSKHRKESDKPQAYRTEKAKHSQSRNQASSRSRDKENVRDPIHSSNKISVSHAISTSSASPNSKPKSPRLVTESVTPEGQTHAISVTGPISNLLSASTNITCSTPHSVNSSSINKPLGTMEATLVNVTNKVMASIAHVTEPKASIQENNSHLVSVTGAAVSESVSKETKACACGSKATVSKAEGSRVISKTSSGGAEAQPDEANVVTGILAAGARTRKEPGVPVSCSRPPPPSVFQPHVPSAIMLQKHHQTPNDPRQHLSNQQRDTHLLTNQHPLVLKPANRNAAPQQRTNRATEVPGCSTGTQGRQPLQSLQQNFITNREKMPANMVNKSRIPMWDEFLKFILKWNPSWFEERENMEKSSARRIVPPPVAHELSGPSLYPLVKQYVNYQEYSEKFMLPLLLHETWESCFSTWREEKSRRHGRKQCFMLSSNQPNPKVKCSTYTLQGLISEADKKMDNFIKEGDLVIMTVYGMVEDRQQMKAQSDRTATGPAAPSAASEQTGSQQGTWQRIPWLGFVHKVNFRKDFSVDKFCAHNPEMAKRRPQRALPMTVSVTVRLRSVRLDNSKHVEIEPVSNLVNTKRQFNGLSRLPENPLCSHLLYPTTNSTYTDMAPASVLSMKGAYNDSQSKAINTAARVSILSYDKPRVCLLQGPPGTGKSHTIIGIIKKIVQESGRKGRVCLCAPSHSAVDELLRRLVRHNREKKGQEIRLVRLGRKTNVHPDLYPYLKDVQVHEHIVRAHKAELVRQLPQSLRGELQALDIKITALKKKMEAGTELHQKRRYVTDLKKLEREKELISSKCQVDVHNLNFDPRQRDLAARVVLGQAHVIAGTLSSIGSQEVKSIFQSMAGKDRQAFNCIIIDEASQAIELDTLIPLQYGSTKLILVGDPQQLPPTVLSQVAAENKFDMSLFARLDDYFQTSDQSPVILLDTQYRMHPQIASFPNQYIYEGKIKTDRSVLDRPGCPLVPYLLYDIVEGQEMFSQHSRSMCNVQEARFTAELCKFIVDHSNVTERVIGIIAPYNKQKTEVLGQLKNRNLLSIEVSTVDGFQGREKHVIIMTCVRANVTGKVGNLLGAITSDPFGLDWRFVGSRNRMNVSLTRAQYAMYLVGHFESLESSDEWKALIEDARERKKIVTVQQSATDKAIRCCLKQG